MNVKPKINGVEVIRKYRVQDGTAYLFVTADDRIWLTYSPVENGRGFTAVGRVGDRCFGDDRIIKANICRAANIY